MTATIQDAIRDGDFAKAKEHWDEFAATVLAEIAQGACTSQRMKEVRDLVEWAHQQVECHRASARQQLTSAHVSRRYEEMAPAPRTISGFL